MSRAIAILAAAMLALAAVAAAPTAVAQEESVLDDFEGEDSSRLDTARAALGGFVDRIAFGASGLNPFSDSPSDGELANQDRADLQQTYNANNGSIENYTNARFSGDADGWNVIEITHDRDGATKTHYLVADVDSSGNFTNSQMTNSTDRQVDKELVLEDFASDQSDEELDRFVSNYVEPDKNVDQAQIGRLASRYKGHVQPPEGVV